MSVYLELPVILILDLISYDITRIDISIGSYIDNSREDRLSDII